MRGAGRGGRGGGRGRLGVSMAKWGLVWPEGRFCGHVVLFPLKNNTFYFSSEEVVTVARRCLGFEANVAGGVGREGFRSKRGRGSRERGLPRQTWLGEPGERACILQVGWFLFVVFARTPFHAPLPGLSLLHPSRPPRLTPTPPCHTRP